MTCLPSLAWLGQRFFDHQRRRDLPDKYADLKEQITTIFHDSNATFGYRRIWRALR
ncbi:IS3 family transposase, partial [Corynebacterium belfantii]|uniref:IS3 family transposase n=1 Tax=Corynebacterium belfantii TaxID=2014537 RepID=UPI0018D4A68C|nr:transposase [Corynebacterium belfantii]